MENLTLNALSFRQIREGNFIYADKTGYIHDILKDGPSSCCFLSRPRRFGKTLLLGTIQELFQGDRELFRGLKIDQCGYKFERHPVLKFDMSYAAIYSKDDLIDNIKDDFTRFAKDFEVTLDTAVFGMMLQHLLIGICTKHGAPAVILVDEYDAPLTDNIMDRELAMGIRKVLHDFYRTIKTNIEYIRLAFVTGITRFAMTALDSGPNNFVDISLSPDFSGICGFTDIEIDEIFNDRYAETLDVLKHEGRIDQDDDITKMKEKIIKYYDGYNWLGKKRVMNPFSLLNFFAKKKFDTYWPLSGQPSHLSALARKNPLDFFLPKLDGHASKETRMAELRRLKPVPVLFHSGYLTIDKPIIKDAIIDNEPVSEEYFTFKIPNTEVAKGFEISLFLDAFDPDDDFFSNFAERLPAALLKKDSVEMVSLMHDLLSAISFEQHEPTEKHCHAVLQAAFIVAGVEVLGQISSSLGKSDMAVILQKKIRVVIEVKYCKVDNSETADNATADKVLAAALDTAVDQIRSKDYAAPFIAAGKKVVGVAIAVRGRDEVAVRFIEP
jgi:hypothetical protein